MHVVRNRDAENMMQVMRRNLLEQKGRRACRDAGVFVQRSDRRDDRQFFISDRSAREQPRTAALPNKKY